MTPFTVSFTVEAATYIQRLPKNERNVVQEAIDSIRNDPERVGTSLRGEFSRYRRLKKRRYRIFYQFDPRTRSIQIIFIGYRKEGDIKDAYRLFKKWLAQER